MQRLTAHIKDHPKTTIAVVACIFACAFNSSLATRTGERLLGTAIRLGFELLNGDDMLVGIG